jgi:hypothetical protein
MTIWVILHPKLKKDYICPTMYYKTMTIYAKVIKKFLLSHSFPINQFILVNSVS